MNLSAIIFDLGETLIEFTDVPLSWDGYYREALTQTARACGAAPTEAQLDDACAVLGRFNSRVNPRTIEVTTEDVFGGILDALGIGRHRLDKAAETFFAGFVERRVVYEDSVPTLAALRAAGFPLGLFTDVPYGMPATVARQLLGELEPYFDAWMTSTEAGCRKPDPRGLLALADRLNVPLSEIACVGNEPKDITAAKAAGMRAVLIDRGAAAGGKPGRIGEDVRITSLLELPHLFGECRIMKQCRDIENIGQ